MNKNRRLVKILFLIIISFCPLKLFAQTDTDFWFVVPDITIGHNHPSTPAGGIPAYLRFATSNLPATITVSQPANVGFVPIVINLAANSSYNLDMSNYIAKLVLGVWTDQNILENKPLNLSGINNFGLYIHSTSPITAYYEINNLNNGEIWALKGRNALGTNFFTPFQQLTDNGNYTPQPYSAIDIVASEDGTSVTVTPTKDAGYGNGGLFIPANTSKVFVLNKGQTLSIYPKNFSKVAANRLSGTHVTSDKPIAISLKDDSISHTSGGCKDALGDQLIPVDIAGVEYICTRTFLDNEDNIIVVATQNATPIYVDGVLKTTINAGQQYRVQFTGVPNFYTKIASRLLVSNPYKPIIVYHIGGFGCEVGAAVVPPIDVCTGSTKVSFTRSNTTPFYLTMMVRAGAQNSFLVDGVANNALINPASFVAVPGTPWMVARFGISPAGIPTAGAGSISVGQHVISNTLDVFHLGIFNGTAGSTCWFGYFSDFNKFDPQTFVVETGGPGNMLCYGDSAQLYASGGTIYNWVPSDFLDDPFKDTPKARNVTKSIKYEVTVSGVCGLTATKEVNLIVAPYMNPKFTTDIFAGCAPLTVNVVNNSVGVGLNFWDLNSDGDLTDPGEGLNNAATFPVTFDNLTNDTIRYYITLLASDASSICFKEMTKSILVYPRISASFSTTIPDVNHCHPLSVTFNNTSSGKIGPPTAENGLSYSWTFGDGGTSYDKSPTHIYNNFNIGPTIYNGSLKITDKYNYCASTIPLSINVQPYIKASFVVDKVESCSPFTLTVLNDSKGGVNNYYWDRDGDIATGPSGFEYSVPTMTGWTLPYINGTITNTPKPVTIRLKVTNGGGCSDIASRTITVNPPVLASFITNNNGNPLGCSPLNLNFTSTTTNATIYHWLIDGNAIDNQTTAAYSFDNFTAAPVTKVVSFTASNTYGCSATQTSNVIVQPYVNADVALDKELGCSPLTVNFNNTSSLGATLFQWDIENNGTIDFSTKNIPVQIFANPSTTLGVRTIPIKLTASNAGGCTSSIIKTITVNPQSTVSFTYIDNANANHCSPLNASFTSTVTNTETYQWEFGPYGASTIDNPPFTFTNDGVTDVTVPVSLKTNNSFGCFATTSQNVVVRPSVKALFSLDKTAGCPPYNATVSATTSAAITNYTWDFDGTAYTGSNQVFPNPNNLTGLDINRNIKLTVSSGFCSDQLTKSIVIYPQVEARWTALPATNGCTPLTVNLQNQSALFGTNAPISSILWDFNDNTSSIATNISHIFTNLDNTLPKTFNVSLTATTPRGCVDTKTFPVTVNPTVSAAFNAQIIKQCTPMQVQILNASFAGPTISTYNWNFNGGVPQGTVDDDFVVEFANPDPENPVNRTVTLNLNNTFGCTSSASQTFAVDPQVIAGLNIALPLTGGGVPIDRLCAPANFTFKNLSTGGNISFTWDFNDGDIQTISNRNNIAHLFENRTATTKQFDVKLNALNTKGCSSNATQTVFAFPEVNSRFSMTRDSACTPFYIKLKDESLNGTQWSWDFGHTIGGVPQQKTSLVSGESFTRLIDNETTTDEIKKYKINLRLDDLVTGCWDTISRFIQVYPKVISTFNVSPVSGCSPTIITFTNSSRGLGNYLWELDNGLSFNATTPANLSIDNPSTVNESILNIKLTATNILGCKSASRKIVTIAPKVIASYSSSIVEACEPFTAQFSNLTPSTAYNYDWTVNGASESNLQDYSRIFTNLSNPPIINKFKVQLKSTYKNNAVCFDTVSRVITVNPRIYPDFNITNSANCHPLVTDINNTTVSYNSSNSYIWSLGNGTYSTQKNLTNLLYKNNLAIRDTVYNIKLITRSVHQCVDSVSKVITVHPRPIASYVMNNESLSCSPFPISLTNLSSGTDLSYAFNLGDGTLVNTIDRNQVITHTYHNLTSDVQPYVISLNATTAFGCQNSTSQTVYAYPEVKANFSFNPGSAACSPFVVSLNNISQNAYFYQWNFKDGTNSNLMSPNHRFVNVSENDKIFGVHLQSISEYDCEDTITIPLTVYATPVANFSVNPPLKIFPDATFNFHNQSKPAADNWTYSWNFGDGYTSSLKEAGDHTYTTWGSKANGFIYKSKLRVENAHCWDTTSNILRLLPAEPIPYFTADIYNSCSPLETHLINASQYGANYLWDFGDGTTSTVDEPIHTFTIPGYYNVKLRVTGDGGDSYYYKTFRVYQNPVADFAVYPNRVMLPDASVHIYNLSKYADRYEWDLGDGTLITDKDPVHTFNAIGEFRVSLKAYAPDSLGGCQDYTSKFPAVWVEGFGKIRFPNAFTPNKNGSNGGLYDDIDYKNEVFHPVHYGVVEYKLMIFNRWGEQLFVSKDIKIGWDGYFNGRVCDQGVYIWRAIGKYTNGKTFDIKGNVTLLK
ncbi:MAG: PKD domain-containing protein [Bacteroidales bacterium]|nr:PKD domain-containing protein [Bacteroidales bacterium]